MNWYLKEVEGEIDTEAELVNRKTIVERVIHRLVHFVSMGIQMRCSSFKIFLHLHGYYARMHFFVRLILLWF